MTKRKQATSGLTIAQIDAIDIELVHCKALKDALYADEVDGAVRMSLCVMLERTLSKAIEMVQQCQIGGSHD